MTKDLTERIAEGSGLELIDIGKLFENFDSEIVRQEGEREISLSAYIPLRVRLYRQFIADITGLKVKEIQSRGRYRLTQKIDKRFLDKERLLVTMLVEKGIIPEHDGDYGSIELVTHRPMVFRENGKHIPPTEIEITAYSFPVEYERIYAIETKYQHPDLKQLIKPEWFLKPDVAEKLKEDGLLH